jgi:3-oxoacyl-[acyl-carrier protein] reductase
MSMLQGKTALVTGAARGIGRAIVQTLAESGATVAFTDRSISGAAQELVSELTGRGAKVFAYQSDAVSTGDAVQVVERVIQECGRLDILVNNAGMTKDSLLMRMS